MHRLTSVRVIAPCKPGWPFLGNVIHLPSLSKELRCSPSLPLHPQSMDQIDLGSLQVNLGAQSWRCGGRAPRERSPSIMSALCVWERQGSGFCSGKFSPHVSTKRRIVFTFTPRATWASHGTEAAARGVVASPSHTKPLQRLGLFFRDLTSMYMCPWRLWLVHHDRKRVMSVRYSLAWKVGHPNGTSTKEPYWQDTWKLVPLFICLFLRYMF